MFLDEGDLNSLMKVHITTDIGKRHYQPRFQRFILMYGRKYQVLDSRKM